MADPRYFARLKAFDGKKYVYESYTLSEHLKFTAGVEGVSESEWLEVPQAVAEKLETICGRNGLGIPAFEISTKMPKRGKVITIEQMLSRGGKADNANRAKAALSAVGLKASDVTLIGDSARSKKQMLEMAIEQSVEAIGGALAAKSASSADAPEIDAGAKAAIAKAVKAKAPKAPNPAKE